MLKAQSFAIVAVKIGLAQRIMTMRDVDILFPLLTKLLPINSEILQDRFVAVVYLCVHAKVDFAIWLFRSVHKSRDRPSRIDLRMLT